jgi:hypothetical protein
MPHPLSGQSVEEATAVEGMASRRTVRVVEIAELLGGTQARAHQIAPFKAQGDLGRPLVLQTSASASSSSSATSIANPSARAILPVADATRAVPTIGATAARTPRT